MLPVTDPYRLSHLLACLDPPMHEGQPWHSADDLLRSLVEWSDGKGRYRAHPNMLRRLVWWQDDLSVAQIEAWRDELVDRGAITVAPSARSPFDGDPVDVIYLVRRQQYRRFRPRPPIPAGLREMVYERDGHRCVVCLTDARLTLDHVWPWSKGGEHTLENLQTMCLPCNQRKAAKVV